MRARARGRLLWLAGLLAALLVAGVVSFYASSAPDGLEWVAEEHGIAEQASEHPASASPLADYYQTSGVEDARLSGGLAGVIGVGVVLVLASGLMWGVRRRGAAHEDDSLAAVTSEQTASPHGG